MSELEVSRAESWEPGKESLVRASEEAKAPALLQITTDPDATGEVTPAMNTMSSQPDRNIHRYVTEDGICVLKFDRPDSSANVFNRAVLAELNAHLDFVAVNAAVRDSSSSGIRPTAERASEPGANPVATSLPRIERISRSRELREENGKEASMPNDRLRGLVLTSAKNSIFIAGADLHALAGVPMHELRSLVELGQSVFSRLASLPLPTVAAIHGACVGGGYEVCLACDYRVASPDRITRIGLPETQLGLLPAWGGSSRLPRLIGLPKALDVILAGKVLGAREALKYGMVDELTPRECLLDVARRKIEQGKPRRSTKPYLNNVLVAAALSAVTRTKILRKTRGHYPAVVKALAVLAKGVSRSLDESLKLEADAMVELAPGEACRNLVRIFFLQERAKKLSVDETPAPKGVPVTGKRIEDRSSARLIRRTAVVGAGVMGAGIAQWLSSRGLPVILRDLNVELVAKGMSSIAKLYEEGRKRRLITRLEVRSGIDRVFPIAAEVSLMNVDLVIEAVVESLEVKKQLFRRLDEVAAPNTILATNTSALSVSAIAEGTRTPERVVGIHFFNPVHRMQLVEVVVGRRTDREVVRRSLQFVQQIGKLPVLVNDSPGFLVNRILMPYLIEAGDLFEAGADIKNIDQAMLDFGMPMGPLRLIDEVGVDVAQHVAQALAAGFNNGLHAPGVLTKMVQAGLLGRKSDRGFYLYNAKAPQVNSGVRVLQTRDEAEGFTREQLQKRMVLLMANEAARCLEEKVVASPDDVDFAMIMGTGFAPFRGGPLRYVDSAGIDKLVGEMNRLVQSGAPHFQPCGLLETMARDRKKFYEHA